MKHSKDKENSVGVRTKEFKKNINILSCNTMINSK